MNAIEWIDQQLDKLRGEVAQLEADRRKLSPNGSATTVKPPAPDAKMFGVSDSAPAAQKAYEYLKEHRGEWFGASAISRAIRRGRPSVYLRILVARAGVERRGFDVATEYRLP